MSLRDLRDRFHVRLRQILELFVHVGDRGDVREGPLREAVDAPETDALAVQRRRLKIRKRAFYLDAKVDLDRRR